MKKNRNSITENKQYKGCVGCKRQGTVGDKDTHEKCYSCIRGLLIRGEVFDYYLKEEEDDTVCNI